MNYHIPLRERRCLAARLLYSDVIGPHRPYPKDEQATYERIEQQLISLANLTLDDQTNTALDAFLDQLTNDIAITIEPLRRGSHTIVIDNVIREFKGRVASLRCSTCTTGQVCSGAPSDDMIVSARGLCMEPIFTWFPKIVDVAAKHYSRYSSLFKASNKPTVSLSTAFSGVKPHDVPVPLFAGGATRYYDDASQLNSEVQLVFSVRNFDFGTYMCIPYILFHECICHAFQSIVGVPSSSLRISSEPDDAFTEGWMDWIAYKLLLDEIDNGLKLAHPNEVSDAGTRLHLARADYSNPEASLHATERAFGRDVADRVLYLFERLPESSSVAWDAFLRFSFDLNLLADFGAVREHFVSVLEFYLPRRGAVLDPPNKTGTITAIFRKYLKTNDLPELLEGILR